jgi:hypothetical protein
MIAKTTHTKLVGQHAHGMQHVKQHAKVLVWGGETQWKFVRT